MFAFKKKKNKIPIVHAVTKRAVNASDAQSHCFHALYGMYTEPTLSIHNIFSCPAEHVMCGMLYRYQMWVRQLVEGVVPPACIIN
jgi:hypothetical protein